MKRLRVYWRTEPNDLRVLDSVPHLRLGPDQEEAITTDAGAVDIRELAREYAGNFWMEDVRDLEPRAAAELVRQLTPHSRWPELMERLIIMVGTEDQSAAEHLSGQLREGLPPRA